MRRWPHRGVVLAPAQRKENETAATQAVKTPPVPIMERETQWSEDSINSGSMALAQPPLPAEAVSCNQRKGLSCNFCFSALWALLSHAEK